MHKGDRVQVIGTDQCQLHAGQTGTIASSTIAPNQAGEPMRLVQLDGVVNGPWSGQWWIEESELTITDAATGGQDG